MNKSRDIFKNLKIHHPRIGIKRLRIVPVILGIVTLLLGITLFLAARSIVRCWSMTQLPGISPESCGQSASGGIGTPVVNEQGTPVALPPTPVVIPEVELPSWDGASRVNILFIGLDYRDYIVNEGPPRSDTMILFTVDPQTKTAGMLSIPRDLWVNIPGFGYSRINTAYSSGEGSQLPGGASGQPPPISRSQEEPRRGLLLRIFIRHKLLRVTTSPHGPPHNLTSRQA